ncbi:hypothetical protein Nizo3893_3189 [Lactiplantibacillus plantarum]|jgi:hypothetical protein|nr:hypothetical protein Nizo3893_3189 [Lactiplantibacillus plantarum]
MAVKKEPYHKIEFYGPSTLFDKVPNFNNQIKKAARSIQEQAA